MSNIIPLILCGGKGTRLWPLSRKSFPKQYLSIFGESNKSLLQQTYQRISGLENLYSPIIVCNEEHRFLVAEQMRSINVKPASIILEPIGRNTAPAISLGALKAMEIDKDSILLILSADHKIEDNLHFLKVIKKGILIADQNRLVTYGILPTNPETGYGYIESEMPLDSDKIEGSEIKNFIEKPDQKLANTLYKDKRYTWNSGIFTFKTNLIIQELEKYSPKIIKYCRESISLSRKDLDFIRIELNSFSKSPDIPIDIAVMERTKLGTVLPLKVGWSDIGNWKSLLETEKKDESGNFIKGKVIDEKSSNSYLRSENRLLLTMGLENLIVVETSDAVLVANKNNLNNLKAMITKLENKGHKESITHRKVYRPWGNYTSIAEDYSWQVKKIIVNPGSKLSLQMHHHRAEHWVVVNGTAEVQINRTRKILKENESVFIPLGAKHRLANPGKLPLILIEIQSGEYLGEDDIVRFKDDYGRIIK